MNSSLNSSLNESDLNNALNLSNEAIESLVSPHRNVMMINRGDIYTRMGRYEDAIKSYRRAKTDFTYSNDSADYQNKLRQDFEQDKWGRIADMKIGIANQKISEQIYAKIHDLKDAPDVKQLLSGHVNGKNYSVGKTGDFLIKINKTPDIKILFKSIGYRPLMIVNIRPDSDSINLGTIPMFIETQTLINYTCEWWQFICKYRRNRHSGGLDKYSRNERVKSNKTVDKYRFEFRKENYPIIHSRRNDLLTIEL